MHNSEKNEFIEIYKLHAELADKERRRLYEVNRLFVSLYGGSVILLTSLIEFDFEDINLPLIILVLGYFSLALTVCWVLLFILTAVSLQKGTHIDRVREKFTF